MSCPPLHRPTLLPGLFRTWRDVRTLQLGLRPGTAVVIDLPRPSTADVLDLLDGSRSEREILRRAATAGVPPPDTRALLDSLHQAGLVLPAQSLYPSPSDADRLSGEALTLALDSAQTHTIPLLDTPPSHPAPSPTRDPRTPPPTSVSPVSHHASSPAIAPSSAIDRAATDPRAAPGPPSASRTGPDLPATVLRRRRAARIMISGRGRLAAGIAVALAESGIGHVHADLPGAVTRRHLLASRLLETDRGRPLALAVEEAVVRAVPGTETRTIRRGSASLVVQLSHDQPVALLSAGQVQRRQPHLAVAIREAVAIVGPLVPASGGPCLNCLDLHRRDRDPAAGRPEPPVRGDEACAVTTVLAATAYAVAQVLAFVDGRVPETVAAEVEISASGRARRRSWTAHHGCFCGRRRACGCAGKSACSCVRKDGLGLATGSEGTVGRAARAARSVQGGRMPPQRAQ
ncbi:PqqD family protein [Pseudosporangium ferrugineum]|uniref:ThiF family protein n=1 Tax=Pseudosporangium ferrugineum TaxID=439699 RepID=A0A2T0SDR1_9ACTN|nr:PqqD family protein [Pseudosporangium ferrugineum]PRY31550.1 hypothetical protein CLV70_103439 [Pseudosporangium ferrugineum]